MKIVIATPMRDWTVGGAHHASLWPLMRKDPDGPEFDIIDPRLVCDDDLTRARSRLVRLFLQQTDGTHLLFIDSDVEANVTALQGMVAEDCDFIGSTYPKKHLNPYGIAKHYALHVKPGTKIEGFKASVEAIGLGFTLIGRELLQAMTEDLDDELGADDEGRRTTMLFMLQFSPVEKDGRRHLWPEDYSFCNRVQKYTDVWLYTGPGAPVSHEGHHIYKGRAEDVHPRERPDYEYIDEAGNLRTWGDDRP